MVPMILVMGTIFFLSHQPGDTLSLPMIPGLDKVAHTIIYAALGATTYFVFTPEQRRVYGWKAVLVSIVVVLAYGGLDEFHQSFIPGRKVSGGDLLADFCGGCLGVYLYRFREMRGKKTISAP